MKIPTNASIPASKVRDYLLSKQPKNDKSLFLAQAGYSKERWEQLANDIRLQILPLDAMFQEASSYGDVYIIFGSLKGPNSKELKVKTIWVWDKAEKEYRFISLMPDKRSKNDEI